MQLFRKKAKSSSRVGVVLHPDQLAVAHLQEKGEDPYLRQCVQVSVDSSKAAAQALEKVVSDLDLEGKQASYVLNPREYSLHLVEAPKVEPEELRSAVRWKIKDLLDMKADDAAIDVFEVPEDAYRGREMVYVVAALKTRIQSIVELVNGAGLELAVIDVPELAMKNIVTRYLNDEQGLAFMDLRRTGSVMNISRGGDLYLTRRINSQLGPEVMRSPEWDTLKDRLVLEIQRSLDYYESQSGQGQITEVVIAQRQNDGEELIEALDALLPARVSLLNLAEHLGSEVTLTPELQQVAFAAIGATLRGMRRPTAAQPAAPEPETEAQADEPAEAVA